MFREGVRVGSLTMFSEGGQARKQCFLIMFSEGGKTSFLTMFPKNVSNCVERGTINNKHQHHFTVQYVFCCLYIELHLF